MSSLKEKAEAIPSEFEDTVRLANAVLDNPHEDPDSDKSMLSRQFLRVVEREAELRKKIRLSLEYS